jgi:hypothetical protein
LSKPCNETHYVKYFRYKSCNDRQKIVMKISVMLNRAEKMEKRQKILCKIDFKNDLKNRSIVTKSFNNNEIITRLLQINTCFIFDTQAVVMK